MKQINEYINNDSIKEDKVNNNETKTIELTRKDAITLVELLFRGTAYTDEYYSRNRRDVNKMENLFDNIVDQLEAQDMKYSMNGRIK